MTYVWNATLSEATGANMTAIAAALDALDAAAARAVETFSLTSDELATVSDAGFSSVEMTLKLENFLGGIFRVPETSVFVVEVAGSGGDDAVATVSTAAGRRGRRGGAAGTRRPFFATNMAMPVPHTTPKRCGSPRAAPARDAQRC